MLACGVSEKHIPHVSSVLALRDCFILQHALPDAGLVSSPPRLSEDKLFLKVSIIDFVNRLLSIRLLRADVLASGWDIAVHAQQETQ